MLYRAVNAFRQMGARSKKIIGGLVRVGLRLGIREVTEGLPVVGTVTRLVEELADFGVERLADARAEVADLKPAGDAWDAEQLAAVEQWLADTTASLQGLHQRLDQALAVGDADPWEKVADAVEKAVEERQDLATELTKVQKRLRQQTLSLHRVERQLSQFFQVQQGVHASLEEIKEMLVELSPSATEWREFRQADPEGVRLLKEADRLILGGQRDQGEKNLLELLRRRGMGTTVIARHLGLHKLAEGRLEQVPELLEEAGVAAALPAPLTGTLAVPTTQRSRPLAKAWPCLPRGFVVGHKYRIEEEVGRGGMASVYRVVGVDDINKGEVFALKVPAPGLVEDATAAERFIQEIKLSRRLSEAAARVVPPPPLVAMYDYVPFEDPQGKRKIYALVLKFVEGKSLARLLAERRAAGELLTAEEICGLLLPVCAALEFAHGQSPPLLHRDVKSPNVMVTPEGQALLMDFGIGRFLDDQSGHLTKAGTISGTLGIMPPELLRPKASLDERVDVYMLGKLLNEMMTFDLAGDPEQRADCPGAWVGLIDDATSRLGKRPRTARAFAERLKPGGKEASQQRQEVQRDDEKEPTALLSRREPHPGEMLDITLPGGVPMKFAFVPPGEFLMGSPGSEADRFDDEKQHWVSISKGFHLGIHPVTRGQFRRFVEAEGYLTEAEAGDGAHGWTGSEWEEDREFNWKTPGFQQEDDHPVVCVSHNDAVAFCEWLTRVTGQMHRLPTEAEWEYACRGGPSPTTDTFPFYFKAPSRTLSSSQANFDGNYPYGGAPKGKYLQRTSKVGAYEPNALGLYDMHGNVWEWCHDGYGEYPVADRKKDAVCDPQGASEGPGWVIRGGSWDDNGRSCRAAQRLRDAPKIRDSYIGYLGLRVARVPSGA
jgi:formylglycine-generating enzyme required for sulfatase activity